MQLIHLKNNWTFLLSDGVSENRFLYILWEFIHECCEEINDFDSETSLFAIHPTTIKNFIIKLFQLYVLPSFSRIVILEMHSNRETLRGNSESDKFNNFIIDLEFSGLDFLLKKYPAFADRLILLKKQFINNGVLLIERLIKDEKYIADILNVTEKFGLSAIEPAGDRHSNGQQVCLLRFFVNEKVKCLVYKPRSLGIDVAFHAFLNWVNQYTEFKFHYPKTINCQAYGWQEFIPHEACQTIYEASYFYRHLGGLLALSHFFNAEDIHHENLIAYGKDPIIVDCEGFLTPCLEMSKSKENRFLTIGCLILPYLVGKDDDAVDMSAMGYTKGQAANFDGYEWIDSGTPNMRLKKIKKEMQQGFSVPKFENISISFLDYYSDFMDGFSKIYYFLLNHQTYLLDDPLSPLMNFVDLKTRAILRPTNYYSKLLLESCNPIVLYKKDSLNSHILSIEKSHTVSESILQSEIHDLLNYDAPIFICNTSSTSIFNSRFEKLSTESKKSGFERFRSNFLNYWGADDFNIQKTFINNAFLCHAKNIGKNEDFKTSKNYDFNVKETILYYSEMIYNTCIDGDYTLKWPCINHYGNKYTNALTDDTLYSGTAGIVLSLVLVGKQFKIERYINFGKKYILTLNNQLVSDNLSIKNIGLYDGYFGIIFTLLHLSQIIPISDSLFELLLKKTLSVLEVTDIKLDMMSGAAGVLCLLPALKKKYTFQILNEIEERVLKLLAHSEKHDGELYSYAHGNLGIHWALSKYGKFENYLQHYYYILLNENGETQLLPTWCNGVVAFGLSALELNDKYPELAQNIIRHCLEIIIKTGFQNETSLCHGYLGCLDFMIAVKNKMPFMVDDLQLSNYVEFVLNKLNHQDYTFYGIKGVFEPGLMTGLSGILMTLLKLFNLSDMSILLI